MGEHAGMSCDRSDVCPVVGNIFHLRGEPQGHLTGYDLCQTEYDKLVDKEKARYECIPPPPRLVEGEISDPQEVLEEPLSRHSGYARAEVYGTGSIKLLMACDELGQAMWFRCEPSTTMEDMMRAWRDFQPDLSDEYLAYCFGDLHLKTHDRNLPRGMPSSPATSLGDTWHALLTTPPLVKVSMETLVMETLVTETWTVENIGKDGAKDGDKIDVLLFGSSINLELLVRLFDKFKKGASDEEIIDMFNSLQSQLALQGKRIITRRVIACTCLQSILHHVMHMEAKAAGLETTATSHWPEAIDTVGPQAETLMQQVPPTRTRLSSLN